MDKIKKENSDDSLNSVSDIGEMATTPSETPLPLLIPDQDKPHQLTSMPNHKNLPSIYLMGQTGSPEEDSFKIPLPPPPPSKAKNPAFRRNLNGSPNTINRTTRCLPNIDQPQNDNALASNISYQTLLYEEAVRLLSEIKMLITQLITQNLV